MMSSPSRLTIAALVAVTLLLRPTTAGAQAFAVSADVVQGCIISNSGQTTGIDAGRLDFGSHAAVGGGEATASALLAGHPVQMQCTGGLTLHLGVDAGQHASAGVRRLAGNTGSGRIPYRLYTSAAATTEIPTTGSVNVIVPASGALHLPIYGVATMPAAGLLPGVYTDMLQLTVTW